eukprot:15330657-Ditylum_brightwellii.AAC.1
MQACVKCEQYKLGLSFYHDLGNDPSSSEWQWAGGYGTVHPLCLNLALQCMGMMHNIVPDSNMGEYGEESQNNYNNGYSDIAANTLKQIIEGNGYVSQKALISVFHTYESDGDCERALKLMHLILSYREGQMNWKTVGESLEHFMTDSSTSSQHNVESDKNDIPDQTLLTLVMDACNAADEFGLTVVLCWLATMFALCGLSRQHDAVSMYERVTSEGECTETMEEELSEEEKYFIPIAVTKMLETSIEAGQARVGFYLAKSAAATISKSQQSSSKLIKEIIQSFFGIKGKQSDSLMFNDVSSLHNFLSCTDEILSSTMKAYREIGELDDALLLFFSKWEDDSRMHKSVGSEPFHPSPHQPDCQWTKSYNL